MFWPFKRKPKEDWRLVKTLEWQAKQGSTAGKVFVHLYESDLNNRKFEVGSTFNRVSSLREQIKTLEPYHTELVPWLNYRYVPGIPKYHEVESADVMAKLSED